MALEGTLRYPEPGRPINRTTGNGTTGLPATLRDRVAGSAPLDFADNHMRILVIEDDDEAAAYLLKGLSESGHQVDLVVDGRAGLERAENGAQEDLIERLQVLEGEIKDFKAMLKKRRDR